MSGTRVLVVDDDPGLLRVLSLALRARDYEMQVAADGRYGTDLAVRWPPDMVIADLGLPEMDGAELIEAVRGQTRAPIIVLTGRTGIQETLSALDAGTDDYTSKPFAVQELPARVRAVIRRARGGRFVQIVLVGAHHVDLAAKTVTRPGQDAVHLTPTEWAVLEPLLRNPGILIGQRQLLTDWVPAHVDKSHYLRLYLAALRRRPEPDPARPRHLITEPA